MKSILIFIFLGSVFLTSEKFVDTENAAKLYFTLIALLFCATILVFRNTSLNSSVQKITSLPILKWLFVIGVLQAIYGVLQYMGKYPSNHNAFSITGSFENPAGFAAVLAMGFPIGLHLPAKARKVESYLVSAGLLVISIALILSCSRTGVLAIMVSSVVFLLLQTKIMSKLQQLRYLKFLSILILGLLVSGTSILYFQKKDSANGRLLIWKVSSQMIKNKPILGHGYGAFQAKYMDYQAEYFKNNPKSRFEFLADNVKHPFNEFIKVAVEFGVIGITIVLSVVLFVLWKLIKTKDENKGFGLSGLASFLVFACFSYPLQYIAVWLFLAIYLSILLPSKEIVIKNTSISIFTRSVIVIACTFFMFHTFNKISTEIKWKTIALSSLSGNTEEMLPEYEKLYLTSLKRNPFFLYNYGAELNVVSKFDKSVEILSECKKRFNDFDLQILLADNYIKNGESEKAIQTYQHASEMIPCRFIPLYRIFEIYKECGQMDLAVKYANAIINKKIKIPSMTVNSIKAEAEKYLAEINSRFGNTML